MGLNPSSIPPPSFSTARPRSPPAEWTRPDFNDAEWLRGPVGMESHASFAARICLRGRFLVTDPAKVKTLKFTATYHGGAIVYLNGEEIGRKNLAPGANLAEAYPLEAFVTSKGDIYGFGKPEKPDAEDLRHVALRERALELELPARLLRKGVNVLALEIVRAPYHKVVDEKKQPHWNHKEMFYYMSWNTCAISAARLSADGLGRGVQPRLAPGTASLE